MGCGVAEAVRDQTGRHEPRTRAPGDGRSSAHRMTVARWPTQQNCFEGTRQGLSTSRSGRGGSSSTFGQRAMSGARHRKEARRPVRSTTAQVTQPQAPSGTPVGQVGTEQPGGSSPAACDSVAPSPTWSSCGRAADGHGRHILHEQRQGLTAGDDGDAASRAARISTLSSGDGGRGDHQVCPFDAASAVADLHVSRRAP